jgi:hypothetical protein
MGPLIMSLYSTPHQPSGKIHFVHKLTNNYEDIHSTHLSSLEIHLTRNIPGKEISMLGASTNVDMNATHLVCPFKFQRIGVTKVNIFFPVDMEITNTSNFQHGRNPIG